jgi:hypothetical protein
MGIYPADRTSELSFRVAAILNLSRIPKKGSEPKRHLATEYRGSFSTSLGSRFDMFSTRGSPRDHRQRSLATGRPESLVHWATLGSRQITRRGVWPLIPTWSFP